MGNVQLVQHDFFGAAPETHSPKPNNKELMQRFTDLAKADMIRISPDKYGWVPKHGGNVPNVCVCRWVPQKDGGYVPIPMGGRWARVSSSLCAAMGFRDGEKVRRHETLLRLHRAGYIDMTQISPSCWMIDLDSWFRHLADCANNPEMWEEGSEDRRNYLDKNGLGGWKHREREKRRKKGKHNVRKGA